MTSEPPVARAIASRRSIRRFTGDPVRPGLIDELVRLAFTAPAPHHSRPWRFAHIASREARARLADAMIEAWEQDADTASEIGPASERSRRQIMDAPALLLACLVLEEARQWPDERRRRAERDMFVQSLGAALQNILLAAHEHGLAGYLKGAPLFCADAVRSALNLPSGWHPTFLVLLGRPPPGFQPRERPEAGLRDVLVER